MPIKVQYLSKHFTKLYFRSGRVLLVGMNRSYKSKGESQSILRTIGLNRTEIVQMLWQVTWATKYHSRLHQQPRIIHDGYTVKL